MQLLFLIILSTVFVTGVVGGLRFCLREQLTKQREAALFFLGILISLAGTVVLDAILKAGRPTFYYHTHPLGWVSVKLFAAGSGLAALCFFSLLLFYQSCLGNVRLTAGVQLVRLVVFSLFIASFMEFFIFNLRHYELMGERKPHITAERGDFQPYGMYFNRASQRYTSYAYDGVFRIAVNLAALKIRNIQLPLLNDAAETRIRIAVADEAYEFPRVLAEQLLMPEIPESYNIPLHTTGRSTLLEIQFPDMKSAEITLVALDQLELNRQLPLRIVPWRAGFVFAFAFLIIILFPGSWFYSIPLNLKSLKQKIVVLFTMGVILLSFVWVLWSNISRSELHYPNQREPQKAGASQYHQLTEALAAGQIWLLHPPQNDILTAERPYDTTYRQHYRLNYQWDAVFYNGRYYVYFGVVPALTLLLPWYLISGNFLQMGMAVLLFACLGLVAAYGIYARMVRVAFPRLPFLLYLSGFLLIAASLNLTWCLRRPQDYELAIVSGLCFSLWAVFLLWLAADRHLRLLYKLLLAFCSGSAAALAVGCRPNLLLISPLLLFVPGLFSSWRLRGDRKQIFLMGACFLAPYLLIGLLLARYNWLRFGNPLEFGIRYQLNDANQSLGILRTGISGVLLAFFHYLFTPITTDLNFPFIHLSEISLPYNGILYHDNPMMGIFAFPFFWFLTLVPVFWKRLREKRITAYVAISLTIAVVVCLIGCQFSVSLRYSVDFIWLFAFSAAACLFCAWEAAAEREITRLIETGILVSVMGGLALFTALSLSGEGNWFQQINPLLFRQLAAAFTFWC